MRVWFNGKIDATAVRTSCEAIRSARLTNLITDCAETRDLCGSDHAAALAG